MIRVGVVGYGTIGKRVADAVNQQPDMTVAGVAKRRPTGEAFVAARRGYPFYAAGEESAFESTDLDLAGSVPDMVDDSDVVVDATPAGVGAENRSTYESRGVKAIYQGGESADVAETTFVSRASFDETTGAKSTRVASCNTTGLVRLFSLLDETVGVETANVTLVRRSADPGDVGRGPIDDIVPDPLTLPSHHGPDVQTVLPDLDLSTMAVKVPSTMMHLHAVTATLDSRTTAAAIRDVLADEPRIATIPGDAGFVGCGAIREFGRDIGRPRGDVWENCVWGDSITVSGRTLQCFQAIHQESIVVPETVDAIRALAGSGGAMASRERTNRTLGVGLEMTGPRLVA